MTFRKALIGIITAAAALVPNVADAQAPDSGAFFVRLGKDTLAVERYVRTPQQLVAEAVMRTPRTRTTKLTITFKDDGSISWYEVLNDPVAGAPKPLLRLRSVVTMIGDSARFEVWANAAQGPTRTIAAKSDMVPLQLPFYSTYEIALARARHPAADTATINMLTPAGPLPYQVHWLKGDTVTLSNPNTGTITALMNQAGHLTRLDGAGTTFKIVATRAKWVDLAAYTTRYAAADAKGQSIGALSPRDTVDANVGNAAILIDYSRPSMRGRAIFGGLVPWGQVWRTGANAATGIEFSAPVVINDAQIPAGKYTLWSIPDPKQWQLIINKQTGQWGTSYDPKQDLVRIPVKTEALARPVETFTIEVQPKGQESVMTMSWDRTRVVVPIREKNRENK